MLADDHVLLLQQKIVFAARINVSSINTEPKGLTVPRVGNQYIKIKGVESSRLIFSEKKITIILGKERIELIGKKFRSAKLGMPTKIKGDRSITLYVEAINRNEAIVMVQSSADIDRSVQLLLKFKNE